MSTKTDLIEPVEMKSDNAKMRIRLSSVSDEVRTDNMPREMGYGMCLICYGD